MTVTREDARPSRARQDAPAAASQAAPPDPGERSASTVIEAPVPPRRRRLDAHDFPDGGGSGGAEAFSRKNLGR